MNINLNFEELCHAFGIEHNLDSNKFISVVDLKRKEYKVSQNAFCEMVGISRSFYSQCKNGTKSPSGENKLKMLKELAQIKELSNLEETATRMTIADNTSKGLRKYSVDSVLSKSDSIREIKEGLWKTIQAKQKLKRNEKYFNPSIDSSVDKITLFSLLNDHMEGQFLKLMDKFGIVSGNVKYLRNSKYQNGKITEYKHIWQYEGSDCKVHVQYIFWDKVTGSDVRELKVEFNPNKWHENENDILVALIPFLTIDPRIKEFDICKDFLGFKDTDVTIPIDLVKSEKNSKVRVFSEDGARTIYFGDKNKTVNLMVYDKRKEILRKDKKDISYDCLRIESRFKLKPNEVKKTKTGEKHVEYRVPLSRIKYMTLPYKYYLCTINWVELEFLKEKYPSITAEDVAIIKSVVSGGMTMEDLRLISIDLAVKINKYLDEVYRENISITQDDARLALERFATRYIDFAKSKYDIEINGNSEFWKLKKGQEIEGFELIGRFENWEDITIIDNKLLNKDCIEIEKRE